MDAMRRLALLLAAEILGAQLLPGAPTLVTQQPLDWEGTIGDPAGFSVQATGGDLRYQWFHDGVAVAGATQSFLHLPAATIVHAGNYHVQVENADGAVLSSPARLALYERPPGIVDRSFTSRLVAPADAWWDCDATMLDVFPDGGLWLAGFYGPGNEDKPRFAALAGDGSLDTRVAAFAPVGAAGVITHVMVWDDATAWVAGDAIAGEVHTFFVARVRHDGTIDPGVTPRIFSDAVRGLLRQGDRVVVATQATPATRLALHRLSASGVLDPTLQPAVTGISAVAVDAQGRLVVANRREVAGLGVKELLALAEDGSVAAVLAPAGEGAELQLGADRMLHASEREIFAGGLHGVEFYFVYVTLRRLDGVSNPLPIDTTAQFGNQWPQGVHSSGSGAAPYLADLGQARFSYPELYADAVTASLPVDPATLKTHASFAVQADGRVITAANTALTQRDPRVGSIVTGFMPGTGPDDTRGALAVKLTPDGTRAYVLGSFASFDGHASPRLVRIFTDLPPPVAQPPRILAVVPEVTGVRDGQSLPCRVYVAGAPPISIFAGNTTVRAETGQADVALEFGPNYPGLSVQATNRFGYANWNASADTLVTRQPAAPRIVAITNRVLTEPGRTITLSVEARGSWPLSVTWSRDEVVLRSVQILQGWTDTLEIPSETERAGAYRCVVRNDYGEVAATVPVRIEPCARLVNLSMRARSEPGERTLIAGVVASGVKTVAVRAMGPSLVPFAVVDPLLDPLAEVFADAGRLLASKDHPTAELYAQAVGAFAGTSSDDVALLVDLPARGVRTILARGADGGAGTALAEVYELDTHAARLVNLSGRAYVRSPDAPAIAGFAITGAGRLRVLVRAAGPALRNYGVASALADPRVRLVPLGAAVPLAENDDWSDAPESAALVSAFAATGAFAFAYGSPDAALLLDLPAGVYTAIVDGADGGDGVALLEIYEVPAD